MQDNMQRFRALKMRAARRNLQLRKQGKAFVLHQLNTGMLLATCPDLDDVASIVSSYATKRRFKRRAALTAWPEHAGTDDPNRDFMKTGSLAGFGIFDFYDLLFSSPPASHANN